MVRLKFRCQIAKPRKKAQIGSTFCRNKPSIHSLSFREDESRGTPMIERRPRSSYESDWLPYTKETARQAVRVAIGEVLRARFETPQELPDEMLAQLVQVNATPTAIIQ
jgi:hypothetical protein